jgi:hypothetical protein
MIPLAFYGAVKVFSFGVSIAGEITSTPISCALSQLLSLVVAAVQRIRRQFRRRRLSFLHHISHSFSWV